MISHCNQQSPHLAWLQEPDEHDRASLLEFVRGALYSLSATNDRHCCEVHVTRIRNTFDALGVPSLYRIGLRLLALLREAQPLSGGYWLLTPFRVIEIDNQHLFIGAVPTALGYLGNIKNEGLCRIITPDIASQFQRQSLHNWMGIQSTDSSSIISTFIQEHICNAIQTTTTDKLEYFSPTTSSSKLGRRFIWTSNPVSVHLDHKIALCRQKHSGVYHYFSADLLSGKVISEAAIERSSIPRLMFALANYAGRPVVASVHRTSETINVTLTENLPIEEYRLALLLSRHIDRKSRTFHLTFHFASELLKHLVNLGCVVETYE